MQLTSPFFLFIFFPLSLPLVLLLPKGIRRISLSLLSILWYVLANYDHPLGVAHVALIVFLAVILVYLPMPRSIGGAKLRTALGIALPLISFVTARILAEYFPDRYTYPAGLLFISLAIVSYFIDFAKGDVISPANPLELIGFFLFFPTLTMGPVLRSKHYFDLTENISFSAERFTKGIRYYMLGYIKRLAIAAVTLRAMEDLLTYAELSMIPLSYCLLMLLSFLCFYFYVTGCADTARGLCAMYGMDLPADRGQSPFAAAPHQLFSGTFLSFYNYLQDYIYLPLRHRFSGKVFPFIGKLILFVLMVLCFRFRPEMLLLASPILLCALLAQIPAVKQKWQIRNRLLRMPLSLLAGIACTPFSLGLLLTRPWSAFDLAKQAFTGTAADPVHSLFGMVRDGRYLIVLGMLLLLLLPYLYLRDVLRKKGNARLQQILAIGETVLIFAAFIATLVFVMPQFPLLADQSVFYM